MIYCTGYNGFLLSSFREFRSDLKFQNITNDDYSIKKFSLKDNDYIFDFGFPISDEFDIKMSIATKNTIELVKKCSLTNAKYIYASSKGVNNPITIYDHFKFANEQVVKNFLKNYLIVRIPRVYARNRKNGLMQSLRSSSVRYCDFFRIIEYSTLDNFLVQFDLALDNSGIVELEENKKNTIQEIKEIFVNV